MINHKGSLSRYIYIRFYSIVRNKMNLNVNERKTEFSIKSTTGTGAICEVVEQVFQRINPTLKITSVTPTSYNYGDMPTEYEIRYEDFAGNTRFHFMGLVQLVLLLGEHVARKDIVEVSA